MNFDSLGIIFAVKNLETSHEFYERLGFKVILRRPDRKDGGRSSVIEHELLRLGLMQGIIPINMLHFVIEDISKLLPVLKERFPDGRVMHKGKAFDLRDPDGNDVYCMEGQSEPPGRRQAASKESKTDFGKFDVILDVKSIEKSHAFYKQLGFEVASSDVEGGFSVIEHDLLRLVLMKDHIKGNMLNFRPKDITKLLPKLKQRFPHGDVMHEGKAFDIRDPDGNDVYFCEDH